MALAGPVTRLSPGRSSCLSHTSPAQGTSHVLGAGSGQPGRCWVEVRGARGSADPSTHQHREVSCSYSPCARDEVVFFPSADEFITWEDAGMLLSSVPLKLCSISSDCRELRADPTAQPCSHLSTALRAAQGDLTLNNFHWLITGQNFTLN